MMNMPHRIFVYGTLMDEGKIRERWGVKVFESQDATARGSLYRVVGSVPFPMLIEGEDGLVHGRIYVIDKHPGAFDYYEGAVGDNPLYYRKRIIVETLEGEVEAWAYIGNPGNPLAERYCTEENLIPSGRWME
jgi:gamma-glutamylcyclotransferase (GGCT)/AIG2-like uncharacterized protein YtfP